MAIGNINRSVGDIGKYVKMDFAHVLGASGAFVTGAAASGRGFGVDALSGRNTTGAAAAGLTAIVLLYAAGSADENTSDLLAPAALGGVFTALAFASGMDFSGAAQRVATGAGGCDTCGTAQAPTPSPRRDEIRDNYEHDTWGAPTPSPRRDQIRSEYEHDSWG